MPARLSRWVSITVTLSATLINSISLASAATGDELFKPLSSGEQSKSVIKVSWQKLDQEADTLIKSKLYAKACDQYLTAAAVSFRDGNFERARPYFDKAFFWADKLSEAEQKAMLSAVSQIINKRQINDCDIYKYFAQKRLRILRSQKSSNAKERYQAAQALALSCSGNHHFKEAQALLLESLVDLEKQDPQSYSIAACLNSLARVSEESGNLDSACKYYEREIAFTKVTSEKQHYQGALENYTQFLIKHKMPKELLVIASGFYDEIVRTGDREGSRLVAVAEALSDCSVDLSNKFYQLAFAEQKSETHSAMNVGYGNTACEWARMLAQHGKKTEAIAVLKDGIAFCRTAKWPDALERNMPQMVALCQQYMAENNQFNDAAAMRKNFEIETKLRKETQEYNLHFNIETDINDPSVEPLAKIHALMNKASYAFESHNCQAAVDLIENAVQTYEANAQSADSSKMYYCFSNLSRRLHTCDKIEYCRPLLLRIIKTRMVNGFEDPALAKMSSSNCGGTTWPFEEICGSFLMKKNSADDDELLALAKASNKKSNIIFVLNSLYAGHLDDSRAAMSEELETLRSEYQDKGPLVTTMFRTAATYISLKKYDKALSKCRAALKILEENHLEKPKKVYSYAGSFCSIANQFESAGQFAEAAEVYCNGYKRSLQLDSELSLRLTMNIIDRLVKRYQEKLDTAAGGDFLKHLVIISNEVIGPDCKFTRTWLIKQTKFYLACGDIPKAKEAYKVLAASLLKPEMSVDKTTQESLPDFVRVLTKAGLTSEAAKISEKLKQLEQQHCASN